MKLKNINKYITEVKHLREARKFDLQVDMFLKKYIATDGNVKNAGTQECIDENGEFEIENATWILYIYQSEYVGEYDMVLYSKDIQFPKFEVNYAEGELVCGTFSDTNLREVIVKKEFTW